MPRSIVFYRTSKLDEECEILGERTSDLALEHSPERGNRAGRLVEGDAFDARHREKKRRQADAGTLGMQHLHDEVVEGIQINAAHGDAGGINCQKLSPRLFLC